MKIIGSREEQGTKVFIMVDSTMMFSLMEASQSAYLWDKEGLKHLYRVSSSGDSTVFSPPRIVIPGTMESGKINKNDHRYTVYSATGNVRFSADVRQQQKILAREPVLVNGKKHDNCIGIETVWTDTYADGSSQTRRKVIWYSEGVGPVKIISGIPPASVKIEGDAVGQLTYGK